ncbi:MAG TPA: methyltransferase domain-containing protein [Gemmatimonadaceae bacterium]|jgi:ubiquinone/menaquinone biosynthesis C-methylase UbiE|nr:methyltransferase domain-containing protein [Gemmatimonadaceae bacterium]
MSSLLTPQRRRGFEILDDPAVDDELRARSLADVARSNTIFGGARAVQAELAMVLDAKSACTVSLLDVGTGIGDIPALAAASWRARGKTITTFGVDISPSLLRDARAAGLIPVCADALALPIATKSVDIVICSQTLHHFEARDAIAVVRELDRVARTRVIVSDIRRSWLAAAGIWLASYPLHFHPVSRHDGVVSVLRGFTPGELKDLVHTATAQTAVARRHLGFRTTASWVPRTLAT